MVEPRIFPSPRVLIPQSSASQKWLRCPAATLAPVIRACGFSSSTVGSPRREVTHLLNFDPLARTIHKDFVAACGESRLAPMRRQIVVNPRSSGVGLSPAIVGFDDRIRSQDPIWFGRAELDGAKVSELSRRVEPICDPTEILVADIPLDGGLSCIVPRKPGPVWAGPDSGSGC